MLAVKLDERLQLSSSQRNTLIATLFRSWNDDWFELPAIVTNVGVGVVQDLPLLEIQKILNGDQRVILASIQPTNTRSIPIPNIKTKPKASLIDDLEFAPESEEEK